MAQMEFCQMAYAISPNFIFQDFKSILEHMIFLISPLETWKYVKRARNKQRGIGYSYKRKSAARQSWSETNMERAINAVKNKECGYELAPKTYSVPKTTLVRRVKDMN